MSHQLMERPEAATSAVAAASTATPPATASAVPETAVKVVAQALAPPSPLIRHTRRCNRREVCNCMLRLESALFQKNLAEKAVKKRPKDVDAGKSSSAQALGGGDECEEKAHGPRRMGLRVRVNSASKQEPPPPSTRPQKKQKMAKGKKAVASTNAKRATKRYVPVTRLGQFDFDLKLLIASFMPPVALARLGMANHAWKSEVERIAEHTTNAFLKVAARTDRLLKDGKAEKDSWSRYMHVHMNCVYKVFVYYTGYKTGQMRTDFAHWAFGVVEFDPNEPHRSILPNTWKFRGYEPWMSLRANGKMGEWHLRSTFKPPRGPKGFQKEVKEWAITLQPGSFVAVSYQNAGSEEPAWWEAQVWYAWRQDGNHEPAVVYDAETDTRYEVSPDNLVEHFQRHPLHVVDVTTTPSRVCGACSKRGRSFKYCHVDKGHPMM